MNTHVQFNGLRAVLEAGVLRLERDGRRLPWRIEVGQTAGVTTRAPGGVVQQHPIDLSTLTPRRLTAARVQWVGQVGGAGVALEIEIDARGVLFAVSPLGDGPAEAVAAVWPGEVGFEADVREACWANMSQGAMFRCDAKPWEFTTDLTGMRFYGLTAGQDSLAVIADTPMDNSIHFRDDGRSRMAARHGFEPSLGTLAYQRRVLLAPTTGGYVGVAMAFRAYAQQAGLWKSWAQRVDENPTVDRLRGAFIACAGYFHDDGADHLGVMKAMKAYGFEQGYLFAPKWLTFGTDWQILGARHNDVPDDVIRQIQDLGYVCAPFLQVDEGGDSIGPDKFAVDADGRRMVRWEVGEKKYWEIAKWRVPPMLPRFDDRVQESLGIHFDTLMALNLVEHYGHRAYDRRDDARLKCEIADYYRRRGKIIASEQRRDWGTPVCDLGTNKNYMPFYPKARRHWTCPLSDLVYHDSTIHTVWDHDAYDDDHPSRSSITWHFHPFARELHDLLTASPPVLFPEGMLYRYDGTETPLPDGSVDFRPLRDRPAQLYRKRFTDPATQAALPKALRVCQIHRRHGTARMLTHRFLDPASPLVQESEFASGLHVLANFGDEPFPLPNGQTIPPRSAVTRE